MTLVYIELLQMTNPQRLAIINDNQSYEPIASLIFKKPLAFKDAYIIKRFPPRRNISLDGFITRVSHAIYRIGLFSWGGHAPHMVQVNEGRGIETKLKILDKKFKSCVNNFTPYWIQEMESGFINYYEVPLMVWCT